MNNVKTGKSEITKHIEEFENHVISWKVIRSAPSKNKLRKMLEAFFIAIKKPSLNNRMDSLQLSLFRNGVT